jgi:hypothetical protein
MEFGYSAAQMGIDAVAHPSHARYTIAATPRSSLGCAFGKQREKSLFCIAAKGWSLFVSKHIERDPIHATQFFGE